jgi:hypothetical protein
MSKKATSAPAAQPEDLTVSKLPGGGRAYWRRHGDLNVRQLRELAVYDTATMPRMIQLMNAKQIIGPDGKPLTDVSANLGGMPVGLTPAEARMFAEMSDVAVWAFLKSWTLHKPSGEQVPLPADPDAVLDLPLDVYTALTNHAAKLNAERYEYGVSGSEFTSEAGFNEVDAAGQVPTPGAEAANLPTGAFDA